MTQIEITAYFEDLATRFVPISHSALGVKRFCVMDSDLVSDEIKRDLDFSQWCMLLEEVGPRIKANESKHFHEYRTFRFTICKDYSREKANKAAIKMQSLEYAKNIFAHIINTYQSSKLFSSLTSFALANIQFSAEFDYYEDILNEDLIGTDCQLTIYQPFNCKSHDLPAQWN